MYLVDFRSSWLFPSWETVAFPLYHSTGNWTAEEGTKEAGNMVSDCCQVSTPVLTNKVPTALCLVWWSLFQEGQSGGRFWQAGSPLAFSLHSSSLWLEASCAPSPRGDGQHMTEMMRSFLSLSPSPSVIYHLCTAGLLGLKIILSFSGTTVGGDAFCAMLLASIISKDAL